MDIRNRPIGIFDSGMGGLTAVREIMDILPNEDIIYLGDTARVPYGTRSRETIIRYALQDIEFLKRREVKFIIAACGTVSSVMAGERDFSASPRCIGVIPPACEAALRMTANKRIGVIATAASVKSGSYERLIHAMMPEAKVFSKACPMFVPLVENGYVGRGCKPAEEIAREYLTPLKDAGIDTLILGCTHYPLLTDIISDVLGPGVRLISSGAEAACFAKKELFKDDLLSGRERAGKIKLFCTDSAELFRENVSHFIDLEDIALEQRSLDE